MEHFRSFDGLDIAYLDCGEGAPVVLLHGFAADHFSNWVNTSVVDDLVTSGRRVLASDSRGHGQSAKPHNPKAYGNDAMARDVQALLDHLGIKEVDVVGYSVGSIVAGRLTPREPRVRSLVLGGVGGEWTGSERPLDQVPIAEALETDDPDAIESSVACAYRKYADSTGADRLALAANQRSRSALQTDVGLITVPTLVLAGGADTVAGSSESLARRIPTASFRAFKRNHLSAVRDPDFSRYIVAFVNSRSEV